jgi:hypothetical protein
MKHRISIRKGAWPAAAALGLWAPERPMLPRCSLTAGASRMGNWGNNSFTGNGLSYVVEDWTSGGDGYLDRAGAATSTTPKRHMASDGEFLYVAVVTGFPIGGAGTAATSRRGRHRHRRQLRPTERARLRLCDRCLGQWPAPRRQSDLAGPIDRRQPRLELRQ